MTVTITRENTHRAACAACGVPVILAVGTPDSTVTPASWLDAIATVSRGKAAMALPVLPALVAWECPACDTRNNSGWVF